VDVQRIEFKEGEMEFKKIKDEYNNEILIKSEVVSEEKIYETTSLQQILVGIVVNELKLKELVDGKIYTEQEIAESKEKIIKDKLYI
jgi:hypothetical protein